MYIYRETDYHLYIYIYILKWPLEIHSSAVDEASDMHAMDK